jgi:3-oxoacyl-[acyl-carrier-protein] synthase III
MANNAHIIGWGVYLPSELVTNDDMAKIVDTSDEWIRSRTGIEERRRAAPDETTASMAIQAARKAIEVARIMPSDIDMVIVATVTPEYICFPATACLVQDAIGATHAAAFDLSAGCSGFIYAMAMAANAITGGGMKHVLVIGAETLSRILNWQDRDTCVLFGDGAGAVIVSASPAPGGILSTVMGSDGSGAESLIVHAGGSKRPISAEAMAEGAHYLYMDGREVFRFASRIMGQAAKEAAEKANLTLEQIDLFIPHQANLRIINSAAKFLHLPEEKVYVNLQKYGNTSAASIPIALAEAADTGRINKGDHLILVGFGAGLTWGAIALQWGVPLPLAPVTWPQRIRHAIYYQWASVRSLAKRCFSRLDSLLLPEQPAETKTAARPAPKKEPPAEPPASLPGVTQPPSPPPDIAVEEQKDGDGAVKG